MSKIGGISGEIKLLTYIIFYTFFMNSYYISIKPNFADSIACGLKTIEFRTWKTNYRGEILICASSTGRNCFVRGHAICTANIYDIVE